MSDQPQIVSLYYAPPPLTEFCAECHTAGTQFVIFTIDDECDLFLCFECWYRITGWVAVAERRQAAKDAARIAQENRLAELDA